MAGAALRAGARTRGRHSGHGARRSPWVCRCAVLGGAAALAGSAADLGFTGLSTSLFGASPTAGPGTRQTGRQAVAEEIQANIDDALKSAQQTLENVTKTPGRILTSAQQRVDHVILTPGRLQTAVERKIESFKTDDGRVLDTETWAGSVGAVAISLAVLPYIPLSLYSTYILATTGSGLPPGPLGIYGLAEGFGTLAIFAMVLWSITSFLTRARGLPAGPFGFLAATQALSFVAAVALLGVTAISKLGLPKLQLPDSPAISTLQLPNTPGLVKFELPKSLDASKVQLPAMPSMETLSDLDLLKKVEGIKKSAEKEVAKVPVPPAKKPAEKEAAKAPVPPAKKPAEKVADKAPESKAKALEKPLPANEFAEYDDLF